MSDDEEAAPARQSHVGADGRYNLLCQGIARARIVEEMTPTADGYRMAYLESIKREPAMELDLEAVRLRIEMHLRDPALQSLAHIEKARNLVNQELPTTALVDLAALLLCRHVEDRYAVLSEPDALARAHWFDRYLSEIRWCLRRVENQAAASPDGLPLN